MKKDYYDVNEAISRNRPLNFIVGARGIGKTFGFKLFLAKRFLKSKDEFIYLRQSQREISNIRDFWGTIPDLINEGKIFKKHKFSQHGNTLYIDGKKAGEMHALSEFAQLKSNEYGHVRFIIFDEFLDSSNWPLKAEKPFALASIIDTVFRNRTGCQVFCLANAEKLSNEYFNYFHLFPKKKKGVSLYKDVVIEVVDSEKYNVATDRANNWLSRLTNSTSYGKMASRNEFEDDNENQVKKLPSGANLETKIIYNNIFYEIWTKNDDVFITASNHDNIDVMILSIKDSAPGREFYKRNKTIWLKLQESAEQSRLYFDNKQTREISYVWLKKFCNIK